MEGNIIKIGVQEARDLAGEVRDLNPYCVIAAGKSRFKTKPVHLSQDPIWDETFAVDFAEVKKLLITLWNKTPDGNDIFLGLVTLDSNSIPVDGKTYWYQLQGRRGKDDIVTGDIMISFAEPEVMKTSKGAGKSVERQAQEKVNEALKLGDTELNLSGIQMTVVPKAMMDELNWDVLDLSFNLISHWPSELNYFENVVEIRLTANLLTAIGDDLRGLKRLTTLSINGNKLRRIDDSIGQIPSLTKLDLSNNEIRDLSPKIGYLSELEELNLSGNMFVSLPAEIGLLENLTLFDLSGNALVSLPEEFPDMYRMLDLDLGNNKLQILPEEFGKMSRLVNLNVSDNKLTDLPFSIGNCKVLNSVFIDRNPIQDQELLAKYNINIDHFKGFLEKRYFMQEQQDKYDKKATATKEKKPRAARTKKVVEIIEEEEDDDWVEVVEEEDEDAGLSDVEKHAKIRGHSQKLATEVKNELTTLKRYLNNATTSDIIILIAKAIRELIPFMNAARQQMAAIPKPNPPVLKASDDHVTKLRKTVAVAMREFESVHQNVLFVVCGNPTIEQLVSLSNVITGSLQILQDCVQECKDLGAK